MQPSVQSRSSSCAGYLQVTQLYALLRLRISGLCSPQVLLDSISKAHDSDNIWSLPLVPDGAHQRDLLGFTLASELRAKLPADVQLERDSWPVVLDANQELLPLGVPG